VFLWLPFMWSGGRELVNAGKQSAGQHWLIRVRSQLYSSGVI